MSHKHFPHSLALALMAPVIGLSPLSAMSQVAISDTLNGASSSFDWRAINGACLTAGDGSGSIPACARLRYYRGKVQVGGISGRLPDPVGKGALRLTNGDITTGYNGDYQSGAVVSNFTFPTDKGLQVTFKTVTYGGDAFTNGLSQPSGADGIGFFLSDGAQAPTLGEVGGSLGYACNSVTGTGDGVLGGYIGIGIDEYGNFSNGGLTTDTGPGVRPGSIVLRGPGSVTWAWLNQHYPKYYPASTSTNDRTEAVHETCRVGRLVNYSGTALVDANGVTTNNKAATTEKVLNYPYLTGSKLPAGLTIYSQEATDMPTRTAATPITYSLTITANKRLSMSYSFNGGTAQPLLTDKPITAADGSFPSSFRFGFSASTGGGSNVHEIMCFKAEADNQSFGSASANTRQTSEVRTGTQAFLTFFQPTYWSGSLQAKDLLADSSGNVSVATDANWDGGCVLTGGDCVSTTRSTAVQGSSNRKLLTWNGSSGVPLQWASLTTAQQKALTAGESLTSKRLEYLRGDRSNEIKPDSTGLYRVRKSVLGDIVGSSAVWVGPPSAYTTPFKDLLYPDATAVEAASYSDFSRDTAQRQNVVYVGANDGFLHGFRAGAYDRSGGFVANTTTPNDGAEVIGYMPASVLNTIHNAATPALDFSDIQYGHNYYVDATPGTGDLYYNGAWHTWLVGGLGAGGNPGQLDAKANDTLAGAIYALDITDPTKFGESNASNLVIGEWTSSTIRCAGDTSTIKCGDNLGAVSGTPLIRRLHNGQWAVIFGNGLRSQKGTAGIFVMTIDPSTGGKTIRFLQASPGPTDGTKNGILNVTSGDLDNDHITDYIYAGDLFGNLWRFDLTSNDPAKWAAATDPLFRTEGKPMTTSIAGITVSMNGAPPLHLLAFGTGRQFQQTQSSGVTYATGTHSLYGVWDWNLSDWNKISKSQHASLDSAAVITSSMLTTQSVTQTVAASGSNPAYRTISNLDVCWQGSRTCRGTNDRYGWTMNLPGAGEQVIYSPALIDGMFILNTTLPPENQEFSCDSLVPTGFTMALSPLNGGASQQSFFQDRDASFSSKLIINGVGLSATGKPSVVVSKDKHYLLQQTTKGGLQLARINPFANGVGKRLTWVNLR